MKPYLLYIGDDAEGRPQYLTPEERTMGLHTIGAPGTGKSQALNMQVEQDERQLAGALLSIDVHGNEPGSVYGQALARALRYQPRRPMYFINLSAPAFVYGFNIFSRREGADVSTRVQHCVRRLFTAWGEADPYERPRLLYWSNAVFATGMHHRGDIALSELRLLLDHEQSTLRAYLTADTPVASRWNALNQKRLDQFDEQIEAVRNRIDALTSASGPRRFLSLNHPSAMLDFRRVFAERAHVHVNIQDSDHLDRDHARIIGTLLAADFVEQACQRPDPKRAPVALYVDEAHRFVGPDLAMAFVEGRKFAIYTHLAHQYLDQFREEQDERVLNGILSCARTKLVFALGSDRDARELVHEIFVGPHGVNYTEVKYVHRALRFRPVPDWVDTTSESRGFSETDGKGGSRTDTTGRSSARGETTTHSRGHDVGESTSASSAHSQGTSHNSAHSVGATHTEGRATSWGVADGTAKGHATGRSHSMSEVHSVTENHGTALTFGTSSGDPELLGTQTTTGTLRVNDSYSESDSYGMSDTISETQGETTTQSSTDSHVDSRSIGLNQADAETWSDTEGYGETESDTESTTEATSRSRSKSRSKSKSETKTDSTSQAEGTNWSQSTGHSRTTTKGRVPVTRHEEYWEETPEFHPLEEQRQRLADVLRLSPQRVFILRRADCRNATVTVPIRKPLEFSDRLLRLQEARSSKKTGAVPIEQADALIEERRRTLEHAAVVELDDRLPRDTSVPSTRVQPYGHTGTRAKPRRPLRPNPTLHPASTRTKTPAGSKGSEG